MFHVPELLVIIGVAYGAVGWGCGGRLGNDNIPRVIAYEAVTEVLSGREEVVLGWIRGWIL